MFWITQELQGNAETEDTNNYKAEEQVYSRQQQQRQTVKGKLTEVH